MSRPHPPSRSHTYSEISSSSARSSSRSIASSRRSIPATPSPPSRELVRYASHNARSERSGSTSARSRVSDGGRSSLSRTHSSPSSRHDDGRPVVQRRATDTSLAPGPTSVYKITNNKGTVNINTGGAYIDLGKRQYVSYKDCGNSFTDNSRREYRESSTSHTKAAAVAPVAGSKTAKGGDGIFDLVEKGVRIIQPFLR